MKIPSSEFGCIKIVNVLSPERWIDEDGFRLHCKQDPMPIPQK
jgi:hypothetical protein